MHLNTDGMPEPASTHYLSKDGTAVSGQLSDPELISKVIDALDVPAKARECCQRDLEGQHAVDAHRRRRDRNRRAPKSSPTDEDGALGKTYGARPRRRPVVVGRIRLSD